MTPTIRLAQSLFVAYIGVFGLLTAFATRLIARIEDWSAPAFEVMFPPSKPATTERRSIASNSNNFGRTLDLGEITVAQRFSQILPPRCTSRVWYRPR